jgi:hypothetical protein
LHDSRKRKRENHRTNLNCLRLDDSWHNNLTSFLNLSFYPANKLTFEKKKSKNDVCMIIEHALLYTVASIRQLELTEPNGGNHPILILITPYLNTFLNALGKLIFVAYFHQLRNAKNDWPGVSRYLPRGRKPSTYITHL